MWWESLSSLSRVLAIALAAPLIVLNAWALSTIFGYFHSLLIIVLVASLLAFLLNYPASFLEQIGLKRSVATFVVTLVALLTLLSVGITLLPPVISQAQQLVNRVPELIDSGQYQLMTLDERFNNLGLSTNLDALIIPAKNTIKEQLKNLAGQTLDFALNVTLFTVVKVLDILLTFVITYYLLLHGNDIWRSLLEWLPSRVQKPFSLTLRSSFRNYFIGQFILAICLGVSLTLIYLFLKVPFGLLFGLTIGLMAIIPFGGSVGIASVTFILALQNIGIAIQVVIVSVIIQQVLENIIAPRVLGQVTGLNPFWIFIAILTGARVGGLLGVVVAVPTAVIIKEALGAIKSLKTEAVNSENLRIITGESQEIKTLPKEPSPS
ncbi:AI-2E family transporter [Spirulina sp. 06S082]|uniref:AI-2E family transporter n=1 Tax=Spirulina sp. 06S082 TaxID=3110248 RepID=UPI003A4DB7E6